MKQQYLRWVIDNTKTVWWHDSEEPSELERGIQRGAIGATTNPFLSHLAIAQRHRQGIQRAKQNGVEPGKCFAVIMIGRLDDYLRDMAHDCEANISESDIRQAGLAVSKRAYSIYKQRGYEAMLILAAIRGTYHMTELADAEVIMSIAPQYQEMLLSEKLACEEHIDRPIPGDVIERLSVLPEFVRAYELEGMQPKDFITYGVTKKKLAQFHEGGWKLLENFQLVE